MGCNLCTVQQGAPLEVTGHELSTPLPGNPTQETHDQTSGKQQESLLLSMVSIAGAAVDEEGEAGSRQSHLPMEVFVGATVYKLLRVLMRTPECKEPSWVYIPAELVEAYNPTAKTFIQYPQVCRLSWHPHARLDEDGDQLYENCGETRFLTSLPEQDASLYPMTPPPLTLGDYSSIVVAVVDGDFEDWYYIPTILKETFNINHWNIGSETMKCFFPFMLKKSFCDQGKSAGFLSGRDRKTVVYSLPKYDPASFPMPAPPAFDDAEKLGCVVCMHETRSVVFEPCRHMCCCSHCGTQMSTCPVCRTAITKTSLVFL